VAKKRANWAERANSSSTAAGRPTGITAPSANTAVVTASDGRQFSTDDQGKTWNLVQP